MKLKTVLILVSVLLFLVSLIFPVFEISSEFFSSKKEIIFGYAVLTYGWFSFGGLHFAWLANITWLLAIIFYARNKFKTALYLSFITVALTVDGCFFPSDWFAGFYFWNSAMLILPFIYLTKQKAITVHKS